MSDPKQGSRPESETDGIDASPFDVNRKIFEKEVTPEDFALMYEDCVRNADWAERVIETMHAIIADTLDPRVRDTKQFGDRGLEAYTDANLSLEHTIAASTLTNLVRLMIEQYPGAKSIALADILVTAQTYMDSVNDRAPRAVAAINSINAELGLHNAREHDIKH